MWKRRDAGRRVKTGIYMQVKTQATCKQERSDSLSLRSPANVQNKDVIVLAKTCEEAISLRDNRGLRQGK